MYFRVRVRVIDKTYYLSSTKPQPQEKDGWALSLVDLHQNLDCPPFSKNLGHPPFSKNIKLSSIFPTNFDKN